MNQPKVKLLMKGELAALRKRAAGTGNLFHCPACRGKPWVVLG